MQTLYISPGGTDNWEYMYNACPVYGLFDTDRAHPLALPIFASHVPVLFTASPKKRKYNAVICSDKHPSPPSNALICRFQKSTTPRPVPDEVWQYLREKQTRFTPAKPKEAPFSSVPVGFGKFVAETFANEAYNPLEDLGIEAVYHVVVPYAPEVARLIKSPEEIYAEEIPIPADYGFSYVCPWKLSAFYRSLESEPTPRRVLEICCNDLFPSCQPLAEQIALVSLAISLVALGAKEKIERRAGRGILVIGDRIVFFGHVFSSSGTLLSFEDLHNIVRVRESIPPTPLPPICKIEKLIHVRFYYSSRHTRAVGERTLAFVALDTGGGWKEMVLDIPSFFYALLPSETYVVATRKSLNYRSALEAGEEGWDIQLSAELGYQFSLPPDEVEALLEKVAATKERRAYSK